jgi:uncharacterized YccA/Bax inhibitor family protein
MSLATDRTFKRIASDYRAGGPVSVQPGTFQAGRAYDKVAGLTLVTLIAALGGWLVLPAALTVPAIIAAFVIVVVGWFKMSWAKVLAPAYALCEGVALGGISAAYATIGSGIVPTAIVFTGGVFVAALFAYRSGLVRVTPRFVSFAFMGAIGLLLVGALSFFISIPGLATFGPLGILIGVLCLVVAVSNLFVDFSYITRAEAMGLPAEAEWAAAFAMLTALVLVYLSILRILASMSGGGGRRR